ncbi:hypothetical protein NC00_01310 [Xanthomonas cannabis pv. phaseoli]|uniref:Uncharacterized protein n=1 Tax=Xanthomonas cannabis pv. phaseoli TaxID=1885902 RepID=A0AB34PD17_9XANT|nr:hypothetical protein [Xanthomonas cannabis]KGK59587.1 hypothetical protein NC00_01310 [Xanthomonas cannabis pv. phaseoli]
MTLNPTNLSRPEAYYEKLLRKRYAAAVRKRGLCAFCSCRDRTLGIVHCKGKESRQMGMCQDDGRLPQFRLDTETLEIFYNAA